MSSITEDVEMKDAEDDSDEEESVEDELGQSPPFHIMGIPNSLLQPKRSPKRKSLKKRRMSYKKWNSLNYLQERTRCLQLVTRAIARSLFAATILVSSATEGVMK